MHIKTNLYDKSFLLTLDVFVLNFLISPIKWFNTDANDQIPPISIEPTPM